MIDHKSTRLKASASKTTIFHKAREHDSGNVVLVACSTFELTTAALCRDSLASFPFTPRHHRFGSATLRYLVICKSK